MRNTAVRATDPPPLTLSVAHREAVRGVEGPDSSERRPCGPSLDRPRELVLRPRLLEIGVEEHRDVADEQLTERRDAQDLPVEGDEPVVLQLLQPDAQVRLDRRACCLPELLLDLSEVELEQAHDAVDD